MSHYFDSPASPEQRRQVLARIWGTEYRFLTANGVFSGSRLDPGTAVLFRECEPPVDARRLADVGCGFGPIAVALASECPAAMVDAVDVNDRALALTRANAELAGAGDRVRVLRPDEASARHLAEGYDEIWSNPPIRIGKAALHALLLEWLPRLAPGGVARLVVGRHLGADSLQRWMEEQGWAVERIGSAKGFRVLAVTRPA